jgi:hypothetical protein
MALDEYDRLLAPARERFSASAGVQAIEASRDSAFLEAFLLHFCALGSRMTEPVERWIGGAAARCATLGLSELAHALHSHARAEAGHHLMMIADVSALASRWNAHRTPAVDFKKLLDRPSTPGVLQYCAVHEANLSGDTPYAQIAIEYEVEMLPLRYGESFIGRCVEVLGPDVLPCLSFITEHIVLDVAHTNFNARALSSLLDRMPESLPRLAVAGAAVLDAYAQFLADCARLAKCQSRQAQTSPLARRQLIWRWRSLQQNDGCAVPNWLNQLRSFRASVLFDNGRRPHFRAADGRFADADPLDLHAEHILAYDGEKLVGCVRVYRPRASGPRCVTERILGARSFAELLDRLGVAPGGNVEIGRWIVHPEYRANGRTGAQLAAAAAALASVLGDQTVGPPSAVVCSVGTGEGQHLMLARVGLISAPTSGVIRADDYNDDVRVMYCTGLERLDPRFRRLMDDMAETLELPTRENEPLGVG